MELFERLYDEYEDTKVRFIGFSSNDIRYDFGIVFTNMFFGKPLVICMQTGHSTLLEKRDLEDVEYLQSVFKLINRQVAVDIAEFFKGMLPEIPLQDQYD